MTTTSLKELLFGDPDAPDGARFGYEPQAEYQPITINVARELLNRNRLVVPTQWWEGEAFLDEASNRGEQWDAEVRFGGEEADLGEGPQAHLDTVYFVSDGEFSRETLLDIVETADMDALEVIIEEVDGQETLQYWWDE